MYHNILIVCLGNICRSPTAERIMQKKLPGHRISSAGIKALAGKDAEFQAIKTALKHGVLVAGVMEPCQIDMVADIHPPARSKTMLFAQWLPKKTVPDPYKQSSEMFEAVFEQLNAAADTWKTKLNGKTQPV